MGFTLFTKTLLLCVFLYCSVVSSVDAEQERTVWTSVSHELSDAVIQKVVISPDNEEIAFALSDHTVYRTVSSGKNWDKIFSAGAADSIYSLAIAPSDTKIIFAATGSGLYKSTDRGAQWEKISAGINSRQHEILSAAVDPDDHHIVYAGSRAGLYQTENSGTNWKRLNHLIFETAVSHIVIDHINPDTLYAGTVDGIHKSLNKGKTWKKVFHVTHSDNNWQQATMPEEGEIDKAETEFTIKSLLIDPADNSTVYAATSEGIFISQNKGLNWSKMSSIGLASRSIHDIAMSRSDNKHIYAATERGVFRYSQKSAQWEEIYEGLVSSHVTSLAISQNPQTNNPVLWAATKRGLFKTVPSVSDAGTGWAERDPRKLMEMFSHEPSIEEIRESSIRYAEIHPDKISRWRKEAARKAWLPSLRVEYGEGEDWQSSNYFYSTTSQKYKDDDITEGDDESWSVSLTWDFSDLVWNSAQTSIDNRSKLMVQLRDDILNEVTRLYYERRRLQYEAALAPKESVKGKVEEQLRLQELTANIDALTGSFLSKRLAAAGQM